MRADGSSMVSPSSYKDACHGEGGIQQRQLVSIMETSIESDASLLGVQISSQFLNQPSPCEHAIKSVQI